METSNHLSSEVNASNKTIYYKDTNGVVSWTMPVLAPTSSTVQQFEFINLTANVPESIDFYPVLTNVKGLTQCYEYIAGTSTTEMIVDLTNTLVSNKTDNIYVDSNGLKIQDIYKLSVVLGSSGYYESDVINLSSFTSINSFVEK